MFTLSIMICSNFSFNFLTNLCKKIDYFPNQSRYNYTCNIIVWSSYFRDIKIVKDC